MTLFNFWKSSTNTSFSTQLKNFKDKLNRWTPARLWRMLKIFDESSSFQFSFKMSTISPRRPIGISARKISAKVWPWIEVIYWYFLTLSFWHLRQDFWNSWLFLGVLKSPEVMLSLEGVFSFALSAYGFHGCFLLCRPENLWIYLSNVLVSNLSGMAGGQAKLRGVFLEGGG